MPTLEQVEQARAQLETALKALEDYDVDALVRRDLGAEFNFIAARPYLEDLVRLFEDVRRHSFDRASHACFAQLKQAADEAKNVFEELKNFTAKGQSNAEQAHQQLLQKVGNVYETTYEKVSPRLAYAVRLGTDFIALENTARAHTEETQHIRDELTKQGEEFQKEANDILTGIKAAAAEAGVAAHTTNFKNEATAHDSASTWWLGATGLSLLATFAYASIVLQKWLTNGPPDLNQAQGIGLAIAKLATLSVLYIAVAFCARTYRAHRHNSTANKHRANALATFEAFTKAAIDQQTRDAVLLYVAQAIFSPQSTGYLGGKDYEQSPTAQILEIIRGKSPAQSGD